MSAAVQIFVRNNIPKAGMGDSTMTKPSGYAGKIFSVDLSAGKMTNMPTMVKFIF